MHERPRRTPCAFHLIRANGSRQTFPVEGEDVDQAAGAVLRHWVEGDLVLARDEAGHSIRVLPAPWGDATPAGHLRRVR